MALSKETLNGCLLLLSQVDFRAYRFDIPHDDDADYDIACTMRDEILAELDELESEQGE